MTMAAPNDMALLWAADDAKLTQAQFRLFGRIYRRYNRTHGCYESLPEMAKGCKMSLNTARDAKRDLLARRMVVETERPGQTSRLDVTAPVEWIPLPIEDRGTPTKRTPTKSGTPTNPGEGYPYQSRGDEVNTKANPRDTPYVRALAPDEPPTLEAVLTRAAMAGVKEEVATDFFWYYDALGWKVNGKPIEKWPSKLMGWKINQPRYDRKNEPRRRNGANAASEHDPAETFAAVRELVRGAAGRGPGGVGGAG
jgi:hypothetical protein